MKIRIGLAVLLTVTVLLVGVAAAAEAPRTILALGSADFISADAAPGAEILSDLGSRTLHEVSVVVLANIAYGNLPAPVAQELERYVTGGGTLLLTGGSQAFGSGGYQAVSSLIPFLIRGGGDWRATPFKPPIAIQPGHPILAGVTFLSVGNLNDTNPRPGATEILRASGGQGSFPAPLIAELGSGTGRVIGVAFDLSEFSGMRDRDLFVRNTLTYLLGASRIASPR
ncbi:MAG: hypothetical protein WC713_08950 [Candidatus Methylomirabilota bacterium]